MLSMAPPRLSQGLTPADVHEATNDTLMRWAGRLVAELDRREQAGEIQTDSERKRAK